MEKPAGKTRTVFYAGVIRKYRKYHIHASRRRQGEESATGSVRPRAAKSICRRPRVFQFSSPSVLSGWKKISLPARRCVNLHARAHPPGRPFSNRSTDNIIIIIPRSKYNTRVRIYRYTHVYKCIYCSNSSCGFARVRQFPITRPNNVNACDPLEISPTENIASTDKISSALR